jgi:hypothetical protein
MKSDVTADGYEKIPKNDYDAVMFALVNKGYIFILRTFSNRSIC